VFIRFGFVVTQGEFFETIGRHEGGGGEAPEGAHIFAPRERNIISFFSSSSSRVHLFF